MIDLEFRSQAILPEKWQAGRFGDVGDSVLYHSLFGLASRKRFWALDRALRFESASWRLRS